MCGAAGDRGDKFINSSPYIINRNILYILPRVMTAEFKNPTNQLTK
jgi:hypothetical protein